MPDSLTSKEKVEALIRQVNARIPSSVTPATRIEIHPCEWLELVDEVRAAAEPPAVAVAGDYLPTTIAQFELRASRLLADEQAKVSPDNALIGFLCDAVRLARENERLAKSGIAQPPKSAHLREPPHCASCSCPPYDAEAFGAIATIRDASLTWAMACTCDCPACLAFYDAILEANGERPAPTKETLPAVCPSCGARRDAKGECEHEPGCPWFDRYFQRLRGETSKAHAHTWEPNDVGGAVCKCGEHADGWYCPKSPTRICSYGKGNFDSCDYCGQPEERK